MQNLFRGVWNFDNKLGFGESRLQGRWNKAPQTEYCKTKRNIHEEWCHLFLGLFEKFDLLQMPNEKLIP